MGYGCGGGKVCLVVHLSQPVSREGGEGDRPPAAATATAATAASLSNSRPSFPLPFSLLSKRHKRSIKVELRMFVLTTLSAFFLEVLGLKTKESPGVSNHAVSEVASLAAEEYIPSLSPTLPGCGGQEC